MASNSEINSPAEADREGSGRESISTPVEISEGEKLSDFLDNIEEITPTIPDSLTSYYLKKSGFETSDPRLVRLISLAAQKFISEVSNDALQHCKMTGIGQSIKKNSREKVYTLTIENLQPALDDYGIQLQKSAYYP